jgi:hypothetical protein
VIATSEEDARKSGVLGIFVTTPGSRHRSSTRFIPGRLGHGHSLPGPWESLEGPLTSINLLARQLTTDTFGTDERRYVLAIPLYIVVDDV